MGVFVGLEPHQPDTIVGTPAGAALASSSSEFPASALLNDRAFETWRSAGLTSAQTRFIARYTGGQRGELIGIRNCNLDSKGGLRVTCAPVGGWARRGSLVYNGVSTNDAIVTSGVISTSASFTMRIVMSLMARQDSVATIHPAYVSNASALSGTGSDYSFRISISNGNQFALIVTRHSAGSLSLTGSYPDDGQPHCVDLVVDDATNTATLYVDGAVIDSDLLTGVAHVPASNQFLVVARHGGISVSYSRLYSRALSASEISSPPVPLTGGEPGVVVSWPFTDGSGSTVTDEGPTGINGTAGGSSSRSWSEMRNPLPSYSNLVDWRGPWRRRRSILFRGTDLAETTATLSRNRDVSVLLYLRVDPSSLGLGVAQSVLQFGPAAGTQDYIVQVSSTGLLRFFPHRGGSGPTLTSSGSIADGEWHEVLATINGWTNSVSLYIDGTLADSDTSPAFAAAGSQRLKLGASSDGRFEISGDLVVFSRVVTAAEVAERRWGYWHHGNEPNSISHLYRLNSTSSTITDMAGVANLTVTGSPVRGYRAYDDAAGFAADTVGRRTTPPGLLPTDLFLDMGSEIEIGEISVELFNSTHPSGYVSVGAVDLFEGLRPEAGARPGTEEGIEVGAIEWSESGIPSIDSDAARASLELNLSLLQEHERSRIRQALERTRRKVVITREDLDPESPWRTDHAVYGIVERSGTTSDRSGTAFAFERKVAIMEIPSPLSAPGETVW